MEEIIFDVLHTVARLPVIIVVLSSVLGDDLYQGESDLRKSLTFKERIDKMNEKIDTFDAIGLVELLLGNAADTGFSPAVLSGGDVLLDPADDAVGDADESKDDECQETTFPQVLLPVPLSAIASSSKWKWW